MQDDETEAGDMPQKQDAKIGQLKKV